MRFDKGSYFAEFTNSAAATCSFNLTAATRNILVEAVTIQSDLSNAVVIIQASGTTLWQMKAGSSSVPAHFAGLKIDAGDAQTLSANLTASSLGGYIGLCGMVRQL